MGPMLMGSVEDESHDDEDEDGAGDTAQADTFRTFEYQMHLQYSSSTWIR